MFSPQKPLTIITGLALLITLSDASYSQNSEYQRRMAVMQQARARGTVNGPMATDSYDMQSVSSNVRSANAIGSGYRTAQFHENSIMDSGSPAIAYDAGVYEPSMAGAYYEDAYPGGVISYDHSPDLAAGCGESCGYFDDQCCGRGGCPSGNCWINNFGNLFRRGEFFVGAQGFQTPWLATPGTAETQLFEDSNFGFYGGFNFGLPLCRISCGLFAGQFGVRTVQSSFNGNEFTPESRDQLFMTTGLYRRVDYGFQGGVVADLMWENWFTNSFVAQVRSELSYAWVGGTSFGFRYFANASASDSGGVFAGVPFDSMTTYSEDQYRFFLRKEHQRGGYVDFLVGWTDASQTVFGLEMDLPMTDRLAAQMNVTYYLDDTELPANSLAFGGNQFESWNVSAGLVWRPMGRAFYRGYDRPLMNVADNGTMLIRRR